MTKWDSLTLLKDLDKSNFAWNESEIQSFEKAMFNDLCSEYDAEYFWKYVQNSKLQFTEDFHNFLNFWREDELNHTRGFKHLYSHLYSLSYREIELRLTKRKVTFEPITEFLTDEFTMCLLIAYDEIATTKAYREDRNFYRSFGFPPLEKWIMEIVKDEARHFFACIKVIKKNHRHRLEEIPNILKKIKQWELSGNIYTGTFVLDHESPQFSPEFVNACIAIILRQFQLENSIPINK